MESNDEPKLGPNATYLPEDENSKAPVETQGVTFTPGKAVNLEDRLGKVESKRVLLKLAQNPYFQVDGGPDWKAEAEKKAEAEQQDAKDAEEARKEQAEAEAKAAGGTPLPPEGWEGPETNTLETDSAARRPTLPGSAKSSTGSAKSSSKDGDK